MKISLLIFTSVILMISVSNNVHATHTMGGQITATAISSQNYHYQIKITIYSPPGSDLAFGSFELNLGNGEPIQGYDRYEYTRKALNDDSLIFINTYLINHTYPGPGEYLISLREFNRTAEIVNMQNSVNTPFYMETKLIIDPLSGINSTPLLADPLGFDAHVKTRFTQNIGASDPDGDSLSYEVVMPKQNKEKYVDGYYFPHRLGISSANPPAREDGSFPALLDFENGQLVWNAPAYGGEYTIAFKVIEWRKVEGEWKEIGFVTRDFNIMVQDSIHNTNGSHYITATHDERELREVVLYPNPNDGQFNLHLNEQWYNSSVTIRDVLGRKVYEVPVISQKTSFFDLQHLSSGIYMLSLQKDMHQYSFTFVKK